MLGISVYPDKAPISDILDYITLASEYGFGRIFTCLLSVNGDQEKILTEFKQMTMHANNLNMEVYVDVAPAIFDSLGIKHGDLEFFSQLGAAGIRLDTSYNGATEAEMTYNKYGLNVEINMSQDTHLLNTILDYMPKYGKLIGCHNFYPQADTGLSLEHFISSTKRFYDNRIRSSAFVSSSNAQFGPWPIMDGLCTLEMHRNLPIEVQVKHHMALGLIDDIIIGNMFASEEELAKLSKYERGIIDFSIELNENNSAIENEILFNHEHFNRGDVGEYFARSTMPRVTHKAVANPRHDAPSVVKRGSVVIGNDDFGQYKNELQIVLKDTTDEQMRKNVVGTINENELFLLDLLKPWQHFTFTKN